MKLETIGSPARFTLYKKNLICVTSYVNLIRELKLFGWGIKCVQKKLKL